MDRQVFRIRHCCFLHCKCHSPLFCSFGAGCDSLGGSLAWGGSLIFLCVVNYSFSCGCPFAPLSRGATLVILSHLHFSPGDMLFCIMRVTCFWLPCCFVRVDSGFGCIGVHLERFCIRLAFYGHMGGWLWWEGSLWVGLGLLLFAISSCLLRCRNVGLCESLRSFTLFLGRF